MNVDVPHVINVLMIVGLETAIKKAATLEKTILSLQREKRKQEIGAYHTEVDAVNSIIASLETQVKRLHMEKGDLNQGTLVFILCKDYIHLEISP